MDTLLSMRVFVEIVSSGSFVASAERLSLSPPMVSKHLAHLEGQLGVRLLNRTSRRISLTEAGELYIVQCRRALDTLQEAAAVIGRTIEAPRGVLKVTAPVWFANAHFAEIAGRYRAAYPEVVLDLRFANRKVDLVAEGYDLALRVTRDPAPQLIARPVCAIPFRLVAAPALFEGRRAPRTVADLADCPAILASYLETDEIGLEGPRGAAVARPRVAMRSDDSNFTLHAVHAGEGIANLPAWLVDGDLAAGRLVRVLPRYASRTQCLYATYVSRKYLTPKVRTFIDFLVGEMGAGGAAGNIG